MINYIKIELKRAFINKTMLFAIIAGCLIAIIQIFVDVVPILQYQDPTNMENFPFTVFEKCLSLIEGSMFPVYYFIFIPIIAAVPYGMVMYKDRKQGYIKNVFTRNKKRNYYIAQYTTAFISAGVIVVIPQIVNVLIIALLLPSIVPYPGIGYVGIWGESMWINIYYSNPYVYLSMYWLLDFIFYGLLNTLALSLSWFVKNKFSVLMMPFIAFQALELIMSFNSKLEWMPESFLRPAQPMIYTSLKEIATLMFIMLFIAVLSVVYGIKKKDNYE